MGGTTGERGSSGNKHCISHGLERTTFLDKFRRACFYSWIDQLIYTRGAYDKFPDFFRMGTFIDRKHMKL